MANELISIFNARPSWMMPYGEEGLGDVFFDRLWPEWRRDIGEEWSPSIDLSEKDGKYSLVAEIPGIKKEDISVSVNSGVITISGKKETSKEEKEADYYVKETSFGSFSRSFRLPEEIDEAKVDASYKDGVLTVMLPKAEGSSKNKKIEIR